MSFDPYHQWLGIPAEQQPPDAYQLLGIRRFEQNPTVISNAAERQLLMLKSLQNGPHGSLTQQLIHEVSAARIRLLDPQKKAEYDEQLRGDRSRERPAPPPVPAARSETVDLVGVEPPPSHSVKRLEMVRSDRRLSGSQKAVVAIFSVCGLVLTASMVTLVVWLANLRGDGADHQQAAEERTATVAPIADPPLPATSRSERGSEPVQIVQGHRKGPPWPPRGDSPSDDAGRSASGNGMAQPIGSADTGEAEVTSRSSEDIDYRPANPVTSLPSEGTDPPDLSEAVAGDESEAFRNLPTQVNLTGTVSATGLGYIFIGHLASPAKETWKISIEDYAAPLGAPRFSVGPAAVVDDTTLRWPLLPTESSVATASLNSASPDEATRVEVEEGKLALWVANPDDQPLLAALSRCGIVLENKHGWHHVQLGLPQSMPPVELGLEKTRQVELFEDLWDVTEIPVDRLQLDVVRVQRDAIDLPVGAMRQVGYGDELSVPLNSDLQCELGITLMKEADRYGIGMLPRCRLNERTLPMVPDKLEREIARSKAQLVKNQRDLVEARNALSVLPQQITRVRSLPARSPPEAAFKQSQLSRLAGMLNSAQSRARRLSQIVPEQTDGLKQMNDVLVYAKGLSNQITVQFRLLVRGERGEYTLLVAAEASP